MEKTTSIGIQIPNISRKQNNNKFKNVSPNIVPINTTTNSENIYRLQPVEYVYKSDNTFNIGLIADDVAKIDPNLAVFDNEGKPMNIKWMDLQTYMLAEIQRLNKKVEFLSDILERNNIS
jgi:hypothetical protein